MNDWFNSWAFGALLVAVGVICTVWAILLALQSGAYG